MQLPTFLWTLEGENDPHIRQSISSMKVRLMPPCVLYHYKLSLQAVLCRVIKTLLYNANLYQCGYTPCAVSSIQAFGPGHLVSCVPSIVQSAVEKVDCTIKASVGHVEGSKSWQILWILKNFLLSLHIASSTIMFTSWTLKLSLAPLKYAIGCRISSWDHFG